MTSILNSCLYNLAIFHHNQKLIASPPRYEMTRRPNKQDLGKTEDVVDEHKQ